MERKIVKGKEGAGTALSSKRKFKLIMRIIGNIGGSTRTLLRGSHMETRCISYEV